MKVIPLTRGYFAKVDDADYERIINYGKWHVQTPKHGGPYACSSTHGYPVLMHNLIMGEKRIDHKDRDGLNNQRENLRKATKSQNAYNKRQKISDKNPTGLIGVSLSENGKRFRAHARGKGLGTFDTAEEAARARDAIVKKLGGEFAVLNFPN